MPATARLARRVKRQHQGLPSHRASNAWEHSSATHREYTTSQCQPAPAGTSRAAACPNLRQAMPSVEGDTVPSPRRRFHGGEAGSTAVVPPNNSRPRSATATAGTDAGGADLRCAHRLRAARGSQWLRCWRRHESARRPGRRAADLELGGDRIERRAHPERAAPPGTQGARERRSIAAVSSGAPRHNPASAANGPWLPPASLRESACAGQISISLLGRNGSARGWSASMTSSTSRRPPGRCLGW
jgi:hypothetical protein